MTFCIDFRNDDNGPKACCNLLTDALMKSPSRGTGLIGWKAFCAMQIAMFKVPVENRLDGLAVWMHYGLDRAIRVRSTRVRHEY